MTEKLYTIKVCYDVMVVVGSEDPLKLQSNQSQTLSGTKNRVIATWDWCIQ